MPDLRGKTALVTGANTGIGFETAKALVEMGARVFVGSRNKAKGEISVEKLGKGAELLELDLASFKAIRKAADELKRRADRLDILVNNAGLMLQQRQVTEDGNEMTLQSNHLGHFLLTNLLLDLIKKSAPARIVNVSSSAHRGGVIDWADIQSESRYDGWRVYQMTKLMNVLYTYELARRLEGTGVTVNVLHPGVIATEFLREMPALIRGPASMVLATPKTGAQPSIKLATDPTLEDVTGRYFDKLVESKSIPPSYDRDAQKRLWEISEKLSGT